MKTMQVSTNVMLQKLINCLGTYMLHELLAHKKPDM